MNFEKITTKNNGSKTEKLNKSTVHEEETKYLPPNEGYIYTNKTKMTKDITEKTKLHNPTNENPNDELDTLNQGNCIENE